MFSALTDITDQIDPKFVISYWIPAVVAMSGPDRATLLRDWEEAQGLLPFSLRPVDRSSTPR